MRERAKSQEETRQRIVEATMHLHEEVGPRATTISSIAEKAGVQRLTVYRHFPDETAVFQACTSHWFSLNPPPDPRRWSGMDDPSEKLKSALSAFYSYFRATRRMWTGAYRDVADVPALQGPMKEYTDYVASLTDDLAQAFAGKPKEKLVKTIGHALAFPTWSDLDERGINDSAKVDLVLDWVEGTLR